MNIFDRFKKVKAFAFDVDGVFTNGNVLVSENGDQLRTFNVKDGYALQLAVKRGYPVLIVSGGSSLGVRRRFESLGIKDVYMKQSDKTTILNAWLKQHNLNSEDILFMGDDAPDIEVMQQIGFPVCPLDAIEDIKKVSLYISPRKGGEGAVRDVLEKVLRLRGQWDNDTTVKSI